jgi:pimeloyl-ACP methyl ester carboxylesterase
VFIDLNDTRLYFDVEGAGLVPDGELMRQRPTVILLHGGPGFDHSAFKPAMSKLAEIAQVIYLDHRGMGRSDRSLPEHWNLEQWAEDIESFIDKLGLERVYLLGQSFGGYVAMKLAARNRNRFEGIILSSTPSPSYNVDAVLEGFERLGGPLARSRAKAFFDNPCPETWLPYNLEVMPLYNTRPRDQISAKRSIFNQQVLFHFFANERRELNFADQIKNAGCPFLVVGGQEDPIAPPQEARFIMTCLPAERSQLVLIDDAGHGAYRDQPELYFEVLEAFIAGQEPR